MLIREGENFPPLQQNIVKEWRNCVDFANEINEDEEVLLSGLGTMIVGSIIGERLFKDTFYLMEVNDNLYCCSKKQTEDGLFVFDGFYLLEDNFMNSMAYKLAREKSPVNKFKSFGTKIRVDFKGYEYHQEDKLLVSNYGKVDLLYSIVVEKDDDLYLSLKVKEHLSLSEVIRKQKMLDRVEENIRNLERSHRD